MGEKWFQFVKRIHSEGHKKNASYSFKEAMVDASKRKSEWKKDSGSSSVSSKKRRSSKSKKGGSCKSGGSRKRKSKKSRKSRK